MILLISGVIRKIMNLIKIRPERVDYLIELKLFSNEFKNRFKVNAPPLYFP